MISLICSPLYYNMSGIGGIDFALLKFCLQHNDSPNISDTQLTRDPADYEWLRRVMDSLPSVQKQMEQCVDIIHNDEDENNKIDALEILQDLVEDIDNANGLYISFNSIQRILTNLCFRFSKKRVGRNSTCNDLPSW